ncbi:glycosyltransferase [Candidatus Pelagibacter sp.]|nr:glycosyltransferase [Candidatus Pelagibacter sp.]
MKISVITCTNNSEETIIETLNSLKKQSYKNYELIIVDNISKDRTLEIIKNNYKGDLKIISENDNGIYFALNKGLKKIGGEIIFILHSNDQIMNENCFENIVNFFQNYNADVVYGNIILKNYNSKKIIRKWIASPTNLENKVLNSDFYKEKLFKGWVPAHTSLFIKREIIELLGEYDLQYKISSDYDYIIRLFSLNKIKIIYTNQYIVSMNHGGTSTRISNYLKKATEDYMIIKKNRLGGLSVLFKKIFFKFQQFFN